MFVVEEVGGEEFLCGPERHLLFGSENVRRRLEKLRPVVLTRHPLWPGVQDLYRAEHRWVEAE